MRPALQKIHSRLSLFYDDLLTTMGKQFCAKFCDKFVSLNVVVFSNTKKVIKFLRAHKHSSSKIEPLKLDFKPEHYG